EEKGFIPFFGGERRLTFGEIERALASAERAPGIVGVIVSISELRIGLSRANSLRRRLLSLRRNGKRVVVYIESGGNVEYLIASAGESIYMPPWSMLNLIGLGAEVTFLRDMLEKLGVSARLKGYGEYKSAAETFTRSSISAAHREMVDSILGSLGAQLEACISEGRGAKVADVRAVIDKGPFVTPSALAEGLIDGTAYESEMEDRAGEAAGVKVRSIDARQFSRVLKAKSRLFSVLGRIRRKGGVLAVVTDSGFITLGESTGRGAFKTMGSDSVLTQLEKVSRDSAVKGLVFRILTPGGSGVASDLIRRRLREISELIPVVVSMSDVSASGGYLIALGAGKIVADPMTLTGSIGIVSGKFELGDLYTKLGVNKELVPSGKRSLMFSHSRDFSEDEEEKLDELMNFYYEEFVRTVAEGRSIDEARAGEAAKGRVWTGAQAKELGLVDELGGFWDAVNVARREAGLPEDKMPLLRFYSAARGIRLASLFGDTAYPDLLKTLLGNVPVERLHGCFTVMPYRIEIK
ncbi:MAG TPA: signal peptide peptidase SppA, partial [Thermodesulfobacteriota bacterium]|nr:signal peptide peptidase SppA [Thermodesulfobacteriota bacterium]